MIKGEVSMDNKIAVIYKSKYGSTKRYAGWIALKLDADLYEVSDIRDKDLLEYNTIIYGGPIYQEQIKGINFIKRNYEKIKDKNIIIFMVGISEENNSYINNILNNNLTEEIQKNITSLYFRGDFNYKQLDIVDKIIVNLSNCTVSLNNKDKVSQIKKSILEICEKPLNFSDKKHIKDLINKNLGQV